jgi:hypothetical protein
MTGRPLQGMASAVPRPDTETRRPRVGVHLNQRAERAATQVRLSSESSSCNRGGMNDLDWLVGFGAEPNWILISIFGAILGALFAEFGAIVVYPLRRLRRDVLVGTWHQFNYTHRNGRLFLNQATLEIKKGLLGGLRGTMADQRRTHL